MTSLDVCWKYGTAPGVEDLPAIERVREVYGIRRIEFDEKNQTVRVEYDASRLNEAAVANLLRRAGIDLGDKLALA